MSKTSNLSIMNNVTKSKQFNKRYLNKKMYHHNNLKIGKYGCQLLFIFPISYYYDMSLLILDIFYEIFKSLHRD